MQFFKGRKIHQQFEKETIQLSLGQRISTLLFQWILRSQYKIRLGQAARLPRHRYAVLLHSLEQRALRLGSRTVYLVGQHYIGEYRARLKAEPVVALLVLHDDIGAGYIGRHEVGRKLYPVKAQFQHVTQRFDQSGFAQAWHTLQQNVAAGYNSHEHLTYYITLTYYFFGYLAFYGFYFIGERFDHLSVYLIHHILPSYLTRNSAIKLFASIVGSQAAFSG
jgi:hypothetical protein